MANLLSNKKMYLNAGERVNLNNLFVDGTKERKAQGKVGANATVQMDAPVVIIKGANATKTLSCWNLFEQTYSASAKKLSKLVLKDCEFDMLKISHNIASFYTFADNAEISFINCKLTNLAPNVNPIRLDNLAMAAGVKVTFEGCEWSYGEAGESSYVDNKGYLALILLQNSGTAAGKNAFGSWKVFVKDCKFEGEAITPASFENYRALTTIDQEGKEGEGKSILYVYDKGLFDCDEKPEFFPQVTVQFGANKKLFKA